MADLRAPFPYFGGKSAAAHLVWDRFGDVANYVEPFAGSLAVLLNRPHDPRVETVNDLDGLLVNAWRAIKADPEGVAIAADWPVSEADLHPRHWHLVSKRIELTERLMGDPEYFDAKLAGWWIWGANIWIGDGWCSGDGPWRIKSGRLSLGNPGQGINRKLPHLGNPGRGINRQLPHLGNPGRLTDQGAAVATWLQALSNRLRRVRITCGDWSRVLTPAVTTRHGLTGVLLDPPYTEGDAGYSVEAGDFRSDLVDWCRANEAGIRIALCGHEGEYDLPGWDAEAWKARGGYGNQGGEDEEDNRHRETIWFSPACLSGAQGRLF